MLQVGHIERFSSAYRTLSKLIVDPLYFESYRIAPWKNRGVEVDVILDLMIHDIDMIIGLVASPVATVDAVGTPVLGQSDRRRQCPHHLRVGLRRQRHGEPGGLQDRAALRVFARHHYLNCDLGEGKIFGYRLRGDPMTEGLAAIATETLRDPQRGQSRQRDRGRFSTASPPATSRWSMAAPAARRCVWRR